MGFNPGGVSVYSLVTDCFLIKVVRLCAICGHFRFFLTYVNDIDRHWRSISLLMIGASYH